MTNTADGPVARPHRNPVRTRALGFDPLGNGAVLNAGYVQWAGITAGKHGSFYDYLAGGDTWKDFFSPDHSGTPINLLAYTATLRRRLLGHRVVGAERERVRLRRSWTCRSFHRTETLLATAYVTPISGTPLGVRAPDIVAALDVTPELGRRPPRRRRA